MNTAQKSCVNAALTLSGRRTVPLNHRIRKGYYARVYTVGLVLYTLERNTLFEFCALNIT